MDIRNLDALRQDEGLSKQVHDTLEDIARRIQPITYEPVVRECWNGEYMWDGGLD